MHQPCGCQLVVASEWEQPKIELLEAPESSNQKSAVPRQCRLKAVLNGLYF
jgi:hypothetical protein